MLFGMFCVIVLLHVYCRSIKTSIFHFHDEILHEILYENTLKIQMLYNFRIDVQKFQKRYKHNVFLYQVVQVYEM